jgi:hypothetical protein
MHLRMMLLPLAALLGAAAACGDSPSAPKPSGPSPPTLSPTAYALFNDLLTLQLADRLHVTLLGQATPLQLQPAGGWAAAPAAAADDSADAVVLSAALQVILDVATTPPPPDRGTGP